MTEAQTVLTNFEVPADLRDDATVALLWAWLGLRGNRQVDELAGIILAEPSTKRGAIAGPRPERRSPDGPRWLAGGHCETRRVSSQSWQYHGGVRARGWRHSHRQLFQRPAARGEHQARP